MTALAICNFSMAGFMLIIGLIINTGKAAFLIAGYNTMSPGEQARVDEKKMSRLVARMLFWSALPLVVGGLLALLNIFPLISVFISWGLYLAVILAGMIYMNVKKPHMVDVVQVDTAKPRKRTNVSQTVAIIIILTITLGFTGLIFIGGSRPATFTLNSSELTISGMYGGTIAVSDIQEVTSQDSLPAGLSRTNGAAVGSVLKGYFAASGTTMKIFADTSSSHYIYIYTKSGDIYIINYKNPDDTDALFQKLVQLVPGN